MPNRQARGLTKPQVLKHAGLFHDLATMAIRQVGFRVEKIVQSTVFIRNERYFHQNDPSSPIVLGGADVSRATAGLYQKAEASKAESEAGKRLKRNMRRSHLAIPRAV